MKKITGEISILQDSKYTKERFKQTQLKKINDTTPGKRLQRCKIRENKKKLKNNARIIPIRKDKINIVKRKNLEDRRWKNLTHIKSRGENMIAMVVYRIIT
ncbi:hypothetical protein HZS_7700 [Henneguya salminicola]|nr:hypothetical protein HZS_7700 [Henneguya salminicola]